MDLMTARLQRGIAFLRVFMGLAFLYAGLEKIFDFSGSGKAFDAAGFLKFATAGLLPNMNGLAQNAVVNPTHQIWLNLAATPAAMSVINILVPYGELAIGIGLIFGVATRAAAFCGALMTLLFWIASWDFSTGPFNSDLVYAFVTGLLCYVGAGEFYGLDRLIEKFAVVKRTPGLHYLLG